jgi:hypothetical protein
MFEEEFGQSHINPDMSMVVQIPAGTCISLWIPRTEVDSLDYASKATIGRNLLKSAMSTVVGAELKLGEILVIGFKGGQGEQGSIAWHEYHTGNRLLHGNFCIQAIILDIPSNT